MSSRVINLCFHGIGTPKRTLEAGEGSYWVTQDQFHRLLDEAMTWPSAHLSFDDGNASDLEIGLPALRERGLVADFFVLAGRLDASGSLGEDDVRSLHRAGMRIGSHGMDHRPWRHLDAATAELELQTARERLAAVVGQPIDSAACPLGRYDRAVLAHLRRLGYRNVYTSDRRVARADAWLQPRFSAHRADTPASLRAAVLTAPRLLRRARMSAAALAKRLR